MIFKNLNIVFNPGQKLGLVGESGCGKSTILQLILRFYDVQEGVIEIDGINIKEYNVKFLRSRFGVVFQEPALFDGTIRYNLKYLNDKVSDKEIDNALEIAQVKEDVYKEADEPDTDKDN